MKFKKNKKGPLDLDGKWGRPLFRYTEESKKCCTVKYSPDNLDIYWTKNWYLEYIKNYKSIRKKHNLIEKNREKAFHKRENPTEQ